MIAVLHDDRALALDALYDIDPGAPREVWLRAGFGFLAAGGTLDELVVWSSSAANFKGERDVLNTFRRTKANGGIGPGTLFHIAANDYGWVRPRDASVITPRARQVEPAVRRHIERQAPKVDVAALLPRLIQATNDHPYIERKDGMPDGLYVVPKSDRFRNGGEFMAGALAIPAYPEGDPSKGPTSFQFITVGDAARRLKAAGRSDKLNLKDAPMLGGWHVVGKLVADGYIYLVEGIGTGWAVNKAKNSPAVVCFGWGMARSVAAALRKRYPAAHVVLVPDAGKEADAEKIAAELGCAWVQMPAGSPNNYDANDYAKDEGYDGLRVLLDQLREPNAPVDVWKLDSFKVPQRAQTLLNKLRDEQHGSEEATAALAWSIVKRLAPSVPLVLNVEAVAALLREYRPAVLTDVTIKGLMARLERWVLAREKCALNAVRLPAAAARRHRIEVLHDLPELEAKDYRGVILLAAPMGSGKTLRVGAPFARWAMKQRDTEARFMATCHRTSLVDELARRLGCAHYNRIPRETVDMEVGIATCLPSIVKAAHAPIVERVKYLFIDEVAQVLRSLASDVTVADRKGAGDVFRALVELVRNADCVIAADAGMDARTLAFMEHCRPGEQFRIIKVKHQRLGFKVRMGYGNAALMHAYGEAEARLRRGERLWIGCGEQARAIEVGRHLQRAGKPVLVLHGDNKGNAEQAAFWRDPEGESRKYAAVIHTGVISSGLSITHSTTGRWFNHGMFFGSGATVTPADAMQMLRRVRYIKTWTVVATLNAKARQEIASSEARLAGMRAAALLHGLQAQCGAFDKFVVGVKDDDARARADFGAGLWWVLQEQGFDVDRMGRVDEADDLERLAALSALRQELRQERRAAIAAADDLTEAQEALLRGNTARTEAQSMALLKCDIKAAMGVTVVDDAVLDAWDEGRGPRRLDRFTAAVEGLAVRRAAPADDLALHRFDEVLGYQLLFAGMDLQPGMVIDEATALTLQERMREHGILLAYLGIVPTKWARLPDESGSQPETGYAHRDVGEMLALLGLETKRRRCTKKRQVGCHMGRFSLRSLSASVTPQPAGVEVSASGKVRTKREYEGTETVYVVTPESWERTAAWAERRNATRSMVDVVDVLPADALVEAPLLVEDALVLPAAYRVPFLPSIARGKRFAMGSAWLAGGAV